MTCPALAPVARAILCPQRILSLTDRTEVFRCRKCPVPLEDLVREILRRMPHTEVVLRLGRLLRDTGGTFAPK
jgi:hypothetical protein